MNDTWIDICRFLFTHAHAKHLNRVQSAWSLLEVGFYSLSAVCLQTRVLTFAQLAKREPFLNTSNERTVSVGEKPIETAVRRRMNKHRADLLGRSLSNHTKLSWLDCAGCNLIPLVTASHFHYSCHKCLFYIILQIEVEMCTGRIIINLT